MGQSARKRRKQVVGLFACHPQVKRVGAKIDLARPFDRSFGGHSNLVEGARFIPCCEHAASDIRGEIDLARGAALKAKAQSKAGQRLCAGDLHTTSVALRRRAVQEFPAGQQSGLSGEAPAMLAERVAKLIGPFLSP